MYLSNFLLYTNLVHYNYVHCKDNKLHEEFKVDSKFHKQKNIVLMCSQNHHSRNNFEIQIWVHINYEPSFNIVHVQVRNKFYWLNTLKNWPSIHLHKVSSRQQGHFHTIQLSTVQENLQPHFSNNILNLLGDVWMWNISIKTEISKYLFCVLIWKIRWNYIKQCYLLSKYSDNN